MEKIFVMMRKEWAEVFKNRFVLFTVAFLPLILTALPLIIMGTVGASGEMASMEEIPSEFRKMCEGLDGGECMQYFLVSEFLLLFMIMPLAIPVTIASYSIVGEKTTRTLEPVLATPISTVELLAGKALAAVIPAIIATWSGFIIFVIGASFLSQGAEVMDRIVDPLWLMATFIVGPLISIASVSVAIMVSSRANDPRVAEQLSMLVMLPILGLFFGQIMGFILIDETVIIWMGIALFIIDAVLIYFATQLFQRETILTRWK